MTDELIKSINNIKNKKFIVTGSSRGIGFKIAEQLTDLGATIIMSSSNINNLEKARELLKNKEKAHIIECDSSKTDKVEEFIKKSYETMNGLDGIVCNAGVTRDKLSIRMSEKDWDEVQNINLKSVFLMNKFSFRYMMRNSLGGRIVNISSITAVTGNPGQANYCASKGGMISMSKSLAFEYSTRNVTVNCVAPGFIKTDMTDVLTEDRKKYILSRIPLGKQGVAEDIANTVIFILSDASSYITGQVLHVNGGMYM